MISNQAVMVSFDWRLSHNATHGPCSAEGPVHPRYHKLMPA